MPDSLTGPRVCCSRMQNQVWNAGGQGTKGSFASFPPKHLTGTSGGAGWAQGKTHAQGRKIMVEKVHHVTEFSQYLSTLPGKWDH